MTKFDDYGQPIIEPVDLSRNLAATFDTPQTVKGDIAKLRRMLQQLDGMLSVVKDSETLTTVNGDYVDALYLKLYLSRACASNVLELLGDKPQVADNQAYVYRHGTQ